MSRVRTQQQRRQRREQARRRRHERRTSHALAPQCNDSLIPVRKGMCAVEFGFSDLSPVGTPVYTTIFSGLSHEQQVIIDDVLGIPADRWDDIVARQVLTAEIAIGDTMVYLVPSILLHGRSAHPAVAPSSAESYGGSMGVVE